MEHPIATTALLAAPQAHRFRGPELGATAAAAVSGMLGRAADAIVADAASRIVRGKGGAESTPVAVLSKREMCAAVRCCLYEGSQLAAHACSEGNKACGKAETYLASNSDLLSMNSRSTAGLQVCVCVCARARACMRACMCICAYVGMWVCAYVVMCRYSTRSRQCASSRTHTCVHARAYARA